MGILLYADDIVLISPTIYGLQALLNCVETDLLWLDMKLNASKSFCMRIGPRFIFDCCKIRTKSGIELEWVNKIRYLGVFFVSSSKFKCCLDSCKRAFYKAFNAIYGKIGQNASVETLMYMLNTNCVPILTYGLDCIPLNSTDRRAIDLPVTRACMKFFKSYSSALIKECQFFMGFLPVSSRVDLLKFNFLHKYNNSVNCI